MVFNKGNLFTSLVFVYHALTNPVRSKIFNLNAMSY